MSEPSSPDPNSYAALGQRLHEIAMKVAKAQDPDKLILGISDLAFLNHLANVELPAIDAQMQAGIFQSLTMSAEAVHWKTMFHEAQAAGTLQHERIMRLQARLENAIRSEAQLVEAMTKEPADVQ